MKKILAAITLAIVLGLPIQFARAEDAVLAPIKRIDVDISEQRLRYYNDDVELGEFLISGGTRLDPTPLGTFYVQVKRPIVLYRGRNRNGTWYNYPNTKWNLQFLPHYYIHGAYWHNAFGTPRSHGCVNVSYANMESLYNWAEVGTMITIHK